MNILAIGTSLNQHSINRALAAFTARLVPDAKVDVVDMREFELPLYSAEREQALGQPQPALSFYRKIAAADAIVIAFAEHNGTYTAAYKNLFDWTSRIDKAVFQHKPALFLSTSPGAGGAASVLASAVASATHHGADLVAAVSVPKFQESLDLDNSRIHDPDVRQALLAAAAQLRNRVTRAASEQANEAYSTTTTPRYICI